MSPCRCLLIVTLGLAVLCGGCGYSFERPYRPDVDSVSVELFARGGQVFRREIELQATEAVIKRIQQQTDYTITDRGRADTLLSGTIDVVSQTILSTEPDQGLPRESEVTFNVSFVWTDRRSGQTLAERKNMIVAGNYVRLDPLDEGFQTARDQAIDELSRRLVEAMEQPFLAADEPGFSDPAREAEAEPR
ncbi:MAG: LPS assembly lipoprotein LptE [Phycisphaerae bacterium]